jgi:hypothetical protein
MQDPSVGRLDQSLVVEKGLRGETLVAILMAFIADYPPHVRINAALTSGVRRSLVLEWASARVVEGEGFAILCAEEFEEICRASAQAT